LAIGVCGGVSFAAILTAGMLGPIQAIGFVALLTTTALLALSSRAITVATQSSAKEPFADALDLVEIEGGRFRMGSLKSEEGRGNDEGPVHEVEVCAFLCMRYPVTRFLYGKIMSLTQGWPEKVQRTCQLQACPGSTPSNSAIASRRQKDEPPAIGFKENKSCGIQQPTAIAC